MSYFDPDKETIEEYRNRRIKEYSKVFDEVSMILFNYDPIGLNFGENIDEYEGEAQRVLARFKEAKGIETLATIIQDIFTETFDKQLAKTRKELYLPIAKEVWEIMGK